MYLSLHLSHVSRQWRCVALEVPSPSDGVRICQSEGPEASTVTPPKPPDASPSTLPAIRHHCPYTLPSLQRITASWGIHPLDTSAYSSSMGHSSPHTMLRNNGRPSSRRWRTSLRYLSPVAAHPWLRANDGDSSREVLRFLPFYDIAHPTECLSRSPISARCRLTWTMDPLCELDSLSFAPFYNLTNIRYLELDVPNFGEGSFPIARPLEGMVSGMLVLP